MLTAEDRETQAGVSTHGARLETLAWLAERIGVLLLWAYLIGAGTTGRLWSAEAVPPSPAATFDATTGRLTVTFGDANDLARFTFDFTNNLIQLQQDWANAMIPGPYLLVNGNQTVSQLDVKEMSIDLGAGNDNLLEPILSVPLLKIYGGPGSDVLKTPAGKKVVYVYGGPGDDTINAEHSWTNFLYGEDGNDTVFDSRAPNVYQFLPSGNTPPLSGAMTINEQTTQGFDTLDFSQWNRPVKVDLSSTDPQVVSGDAQGNPILTLRFAYANRIEKVIYPVIPPPGRSRDFNGDVKADVLFRYPSSGEVYLWLMQ